MNESIKTVEKSDIPVVILAGGYGTRLMEETRVVPKPMVTIGGEPILLHIMRYYSSFGFRKFIICLGYLGPVIKDYFIDLQKHTSTLVITGQEHQMEYEKSVLSEWTTSLVETGQHTLTGTRLARVKDYIDAPHFCLTYGDGLCDLNLDDELSFHLEQDRQGTVAAVHYPSRFGRLDIKDDLIMSFREKQMLSHDYISGGFFMFKRSFLDKLPLDQNYSLESDPLTQLAEEGQLAGFKHDSFWMCMDTLREKEMMEEIYNSGKAPWVRW